MLPSAHQVSDLQSEMEEESWMALMVRAMSVVERQQKGAALWHFCKLSRG